VPRERGVPTAKGSSGGAPFGEGASSPRAAGCVRDGSAGQSLRVSRGGRARAAPRARCHRDPLAGSQLCSRFFRRRWIITRAHARQQPVACDVGFVPVRGRGDRGRRLRAVRPCPQTPAPAGSTHTAGAHMPPRNHIRLHICDIVFDTLVGWCVNTILPLQISFSLVLCSIVS